MTNPNVVVAGILEAQSSFAQADRWQLRPATVAVSGEASITGRFDGEGFNGSASTDIPMISLVGYLPAGVRVMVLSVPPAGNYVMSRIFGPNDSQWVDYFPTITASVTNPDLGDGSITGRWMVIGWRTIVVEVAVTFGAGSSQGSGRYFIDTPFLVSARSIAAATGACYMFDSGTANRAGIVNPTSGGNMYFITNTPNGDVGSGVPQVWASGDQIRFTIVHEVASFDPL